MKRKLIIALLVLAVLALACLVVKYGRSPFQHDEPERDEFHIVEWATP